MRLRHRQSKIGQIYSIFRCVSLNAYVFKKSGTDVMIFKIFSQKNLAKNIGVFLLKLQLVFANMCSQHWFQNKNANFFSTKFAENCDHNIDPWSISGHTGRGLQIGDVIGRNRRHVRHRETDCKISRDRIISFLHRYKIDCFFQI
jgi:hypothetical protein